MWTICVLYIVFMIISLPSSSKRSCQLLCDWSIDGGFCHLDRTQSLFSGEFCARISSPVRFIICSCAVLSRVQRCTSGYHPHKRQHRQMASSKGILASSPSLSFPQTDTHVSPPPSLWLYICLCVCVSLHAHFPKTHTLQNTHTQRTPYNINSDVYKQMTRKSRRSGEKKPFIIVYRIWNHTRACSVLDIQKEHTRTHIAHELFHESASAKDQTSSIRKTSFGRRRHRQ